MAHAYKSITTATQDLKTLIVEDSPTFRKAFKGVLCKLFAWMIVDEVSDGDKALAKVDSAIDKVSDSLQKIGSYVSRLAIKERTVETSITNNKATSSRIVDADLAKEQLNVTKNLILQRTSTAQLAQANLLPVSVLLLFQRNR